MINENEQRAYRAEDCLAAYQARRGYRDETESAICDLISDLLHLADREALQVEQIHSMALQHWEEERAQ